MGHTQEKRYGNEPERGVKMLAWKVREMRPGAKECWLKPPEVRRGKEWILPQIIWRECSLPDALMLTQGYWLWTSGLQNCEWIHFGCFTPRLSYSSQRKLIHHIFHLPKKQHASKSLFLGALASGRSQNKTLVCALLFLPYYPCSAPTLEGDVMVEEGSHLVVIRGPQTKKPHPKGGEAESYTETCIHS